MNDIKLSNCWDKLNIIFGNIDPIDGEYIGEFFNLTTGEMIKPQSIAISALLKLFTKSINFRLLFEGYSIPERESIVNLALTDSDNFNRIFGKLSFSYTAWLTFESGITADDAIKYRELKSAVDSAEAAFQKTNSKWTSDAIRKDHMKMRKWRESKNVVTAAQRQLDRFVYGTSDIVKILRSLGFEAVKESTSAVKGFHFYSDGYRVNNGSVDFYGTPVAKYNSIVKAFQDAGFVLEREEKPHRSPSTGMRAGFYLKPKHNINMLATAHL